MLLTQYTLHVRSLVAKTASAPHSGFARFILGPTWHQQNHVFCKFLATIQFSCFHQSYRAINWLELEVDEKVSLSSLEGKLLFKFNS